MARAGIATVFVDAKTQLTLTPEATTLFKIREGDLGRPIDDFTNLLDFPDFMSELRRTIAGGEMMQRELRAGNGRIYLSRVLPYAVRDKDPRGAVATFVDITLLRDAERLQAVLDSLPEHVAVLDGNGVITVVNRAWREFAASNGDPDLSHTGIGSDYLSVCDIDKSDDGSVAARAHDGLIGVLNGSLPLILAEISMPFAGPGSMVPDACGADRASERRHHREPYRHHRVGPTVKRQRRPE